MRHHRQATIIVDFMYELYHLYDEVALTKEKESTKENQFSTNKKPPIYNKELKPPRIFSIRIINSATKHTALH
jgi:hypothetical protein